MAKTSGPLLSLGARGTIASTVTFSNWRGVGYARQRVIPANPQSASQTITRNAFTYASGLWKIATALAVAPWDRFAQGQALTGRNAFIGEFVRLVGSDTDLLNMIWSPGAKGGLPATSISVTPGSEQLQIDFVTPTAPTGWTLDSAIAAVTENNDPQSDAVGVITSGEDDVTQATVTLTGLTAAQEYVVGGWLRWLKPDGSVAYGASLEDTGTPTA